MSQAVTADAKILILYLVKSAPGVSYQMLMDSCLKSGYMDFFTFFACYNELVSGNLLDKTLEDTGTGEVIGNNETVTVTKGGAAVLDDVEGTLSASTAQKLESYAKALKEELAFKNNTKAFIGFTDDGKYEVTLISDLEGDSFKCVFKVGKEEDARKIVASWRSDADSLRRGFIDNMLKADAD